MLIETLSQNLRKARSVSQTSTSFVSKVPTLTEPKGDAATATGASVQETGFGGVLAQNAVKLRFFGTSSDNQTFSCRVYSWNYLPPVDPTLKNGLWVPDLLAEFAVAVSGNIPGLAGAPIAAAELFADTITLTVGNANVSVDITSPANDASIATATLDIKGAQKLELTFSTGSSATDCNALLNFL